MLYVTLKYLRLYLKKEEEEEKKEKEEEQRSKRGGQGKRKDAGKSLGYI